MRRVDDELAPDRLLLGEAFRHPVVGGGEGAQLGRPVLRDARLEVPVGDPSRARGQPLDGPGEAAREEHREERGGHHGDGGRDEEDAGHALVEHGVRVLGGGARGHHHGLERRGAHAQDADGHDPEDESRDRQRGDEAPRRDPVGGPPHRADTRRSTGPAAR